MEDKKQYYIGIAICIMMLALAGAAVWWLIPHFSTAGKAVDTLITYAAISYLVAVGKYAIAAILKCLR